MNNTKKKSQKKESEVVANDWSEWNAFLINNTDDNGKLKKNVKAPVRKEKKSKRKK